MSTNTEELIEVNGYGAIDANVEAEKNPYIDWFTYFPYTLQEDLESDGNESSSNDLVWNPIHKSPV